MRRLGLGLAVLLSAALLLSACAGGGDGALLFARETPGGTLWVLSAPPDAGLEEIDSLLPERLLQPASEGFVYRDYRRHRALEPVAVYADGALTYHDPLYEADPEVEDAAGPVIEPRRIQLPTRVGAVCRDGWRSSATGSGACSGHGGVARWRYAEAVDGRTVMATLCPDRRLLAGTADCRNSAEPTARVRLADWQTLAAAAREPRYRDADLDRPTRRLSKSLNEWIYSDVPLRPFRVVRVPSLDRLPDDVWKMLDHLPPAHRDLVAELGLGEYGPIERRTGFDVHAHCGYHAGWHGDDDRLTRRVTAAAERYFRHRDLEVRQGYGYYDGPYEFGFDWIVAFDPREKLLFSFILNLQD